jgi:hypothetical protein
MASCKKVLGISRPIVSGLVWLTAAFLPLQHAAATADSPALGNTLPAAGSVSEEVAALERWWWQTEGGTEVIGHVENLAMDMDWATLILVEGTVAYRTVRPDSNVRQLTFSGKGRVEFTFPDVGEEQHLRHVFDLPPGALSLEFQSAILDWVGPWEPQLLPDQASPAAPDVNRLRRAVALRAHSGIAARMAAAAANGEESYASALLKRDGSYIHISRDPLRQLEYVLSLGTTEENLASLDSYYFCEISAFHTPAEYADGIRPHHPRPQLVDGTSAALDVGITKDLELDGVAHLKLTAQRDHLRAFRLKLRPSLEVNAVRGPDGRPWGAHQAPVEETRHSELGAQDDALWIYPDTPLMAGDSFDLTIEYAGNRFLERRHYGGKPRHRLILDGRRMRDRGGTFLYLAARSTWYPNPGDWDDLLTYDMTFRVPKKWRLLASGVEKSRKAQGDIEISRWITPEPVNVAGFALGAMKGATTERDGVRISAYHESDKGMRGVTEDLCNAYMVYSHYLGPIRKKEFNASHHPAFFSQSYPYIVFLDIVSVERSRSSKIADEVVLHEMAHQWFGHEIGPLEMDRDTWLSEGMAEYASWLAMQVIDGDDRRLKEQAKWVRQKLSLPVDHGHRMVDCGPITLGTRLDWWNGHRSESRIFSPYASIVYGKGAYVLHMLRMMMYDFSKPAPAGDARFIAMMQDFIEEHRSGTASTEDFLATVSRHMGEPMDWFFDQWVYGTDLPRVKFRHKTKKRDDGEYVVEFDTQLEDVPDGFRLRVPFVLRFGEGRLYGGTFDAVAPRTQVVKVAPLKPTKVEVDIWKGCLIEE